MPFPEICLAHALGIEISKENWISFPTIGCCHDRKTEISGKNLDDEPIRVNFTMKNHDFRSKSSEIYFCMKIL